jgi:4-amino-4-deoxy-L-arabinose transferase-like glycosyltransferase
VIASSHKTVEARKAPVLARTGPAWSAASVFLLAAALVALLAARWLTRSRYLFDNDAILYARALDHYDLRLTQPPLPGYYVYIQLGRLLRDLLACFGAGDANLALVTLSAVFGLLLVVALYALAAELWDRRTARLAAALGLTGPIFWYQSNLASPRIAEGFFATVIVWLGARLLRRGEAWTFWLLPPVLALAAGVRQQSLLYLLPFCLYATWRTPWRRRLAGATLLALGIAAWAAPMLASSGGLAEYRRLNAHLYQFFVVQGTGVFHGQDLHEALRRLAVNGGSIVVYLAFTCLAGLPLVALALFPARKRRPGRGAVIGAFAGQILLLATIPALLFFALIHIQQIGHALAVAPFFALLCARLLACAPWQGRGSRWSITAAGAVVTTNLAFVLFYPARLIADRIGTPTVAAIREHDRFVHAAVQAVRQAGSPEETLLITSPLSYTLIEQYLPGYRYYLLPGLFETSGGNNPASYNQEAFTNGMVRLGASWKRGQGCYAAPPAARRFVTLSYEEAMAALLDPGSNATRPAADVASLVIIRRETPAHVYFRPGYLKLLPADALPAVARKEG